MFDSKRIISSESNVKIHINCKSCVESLVVINLALVDQESNKQQCKNYSLIKKRNSNISYCHVWVFIYLSTFILYDSVSVHSHSRAISNYGKWKR